MFVIQFTLEAVDDLRELRKYEAQRIVDEIEMQLTFEPTAVTRNRKQLRSNQLAEWELRVGEFRVFYDVVFVDTAVKVVAIGRKIGNRLLIHGKEYRL
jgi:mRNA-degrading endonuclease RelE of RelBE toxin-antitoxin system